MNNGAGDMSAIKSCTRAATGCGGCSALVKQVMEYQLAEQGVEVKKTSANISRGRAEIYHLVRVNHIHTFEQLISRYGQGTAAMSANRWWPRCWPPAGTSTC